MLVLTFFQQWSGVPGIYFYSNSIFQGIGDSFFDAKIASLLLGIFNFGAGILSIFLIESKSYSPFIELGRKLLLIIGTSLIAIFFLIAGVLELNLYTTVSDAMTIAGVCAFQLSLGPVTW